MAVCSSSACRSQSSFVGKENNFHSGTGCCVLEVRGGFFELAFVIRTAGDFAFEELFCLYT